MYDHITHIGCTNIVFAVRFYCSVLATLNSSNDDVVKVILLPHSHNDPGWLLTFDGYYMQRTATVIQGSML